MIEYGEFRRRGNTDRMVIEGISINYPNDLFNALDLNLRTEYFNKIIRLKQFSIKEQNYEQAAIFRDMEKKIRPEITVALYFSEK